MSSLSSDDCVEADRLLTAMTVVGLVVVSAVVTAVVSSVVMSVSSVGKPLKNEGH